MRAPIQPQHPLRGKHWPRPRNLTREGPDGADVGTARQQILAAAANSRCGAARRSRRASATRTQAHPAKLAPRSAQLSRQLVPAMASRAPDRCWHDGPASKLVVVCGAAAPQPRPGRGEPTSATRLARPHRRQRAAQAGEHDRHQYPEAAPVQRDVSGSPSRWKSEMLRVESGHLSRGARRGK